MKRLILAFLLSATAVATLGRAPHLAASICNPELGCYICSPDQVWRAFYYRQSPGGPECGLKYFYCEGYSYHEGCTTSYYDTAIFCGCP